MKRLTVFLFATALCLSACATENWTRIPVDKGFQYRVSLEQLGDRSAEQKPYRHPDHIKAEDLSNFLGTLTYQQSSMINTNNQQQVFQPDELERLVPALVAALAEAAPNQRVRFVSYNLRDTMLLPISQKTEGIMFVDHEGRLNLAFNDINEQRSAQESNAEQHRFSTSDPLKLTNRDTSLSSRAANTFHKKFANGEPAPLWLVTDITGLQQQSRPVADKAKPVAPPALPESQNLRPETIQPQDSGTEMTIKDKLKLLKELLAEGLITETDYAAKKQKLLDEI